MGGIDEPTEYVRALLMLARVVPWALGLVGVICFVKFAVVPLVEALRCKGKT